MRCPGAAPPPHAEPLSALTCTLILSRHYTHTLFITITLAAEPKLYQGGSTTFAHLF